MGDYSLVINNGTGGTVTFDNTTNAVRLKSRQLRHDVNYPAVLTFALENRRTTAAENLLSSSYNEWTGGTGAMAVAVGMAVRYYLDPTDFTTGLPGVSTQYFGGFITNIQQQGDGVLEIEARDYLQCFEHLYVPKVSYTSYRDYYSRTLGVVATGAYAYKLAIESVDSTGYYPGVEIAILTDDRFFDYGLSIDDGGTGFADLAAGHAFAQAFIAEDVETLGVLFQGNYTKDASATVDSVLRVSIMDDDGADRPTGTELFYEDVTLTAAGAQWIWLYWDETNTLFQRLVPGRKYWIHVEHYTTDVTYPGSWQHYADADGQYANDQADAHWVYGSLPLDAGSSETAGNLIAFPLIASVAVLKPSEYTYYLDGATPKLVITSLSHPYPGLDELPSVLPEVPTSTDRGRVSYYYATRELRYVFEDVINQEPDNGMGSDVDANITLGVPVYKTGGRALGECLRELCNIRGYNSSGTYYQSAVMYGQTAHEMWVGRRKSTADSAVVTFAHGADTATDAQRRILSANLRKSSTTVPGVIRVVGRSPDGQPIIVERDGRGVGTGNWIDTVNHRVTDVINDSSLTTLDACNTRAWAELDRYDRSNYEGEIVVSGVYPHLISRTAGTYGSGEIVALTHALYGLSATKFAVTGITVGVNTTTLRLSNADIMRKNVVKDTSDRALRTDAFTSGADDMTYRYVYVYKLDVTADTTLFAQLCKADGTILDSHSNYAAHRVPCTRLTQPSGGTDYGTVVFRAEFPPENGYGTVERIELYSDATGGTEEAEFDFSSEIDSAWEFYKSKKTRVIVEYGV